MNEVIDSVHSKSRPDLLGKLLRERQEMLVWFNQLAAAKPFSNSRTVREPLQRLCEVLMDYLALGHFEVYQMLEQQGCGRDDQREPAMALVANLYPRIAETTETAVWFNDRYDADVHNDDLPGLEGDLAKLGEALAERIELEDRLITAFTPEPVAAD